MEDGELVHQFDKVPAEIRAWESKETGVTTREKEPLAVGSWADFRHTFAKPSSSVSKDRHANVG